MLEGKRFDVEHALGLYAYSYFLLPAEGIYDNSMLQGLGERLHNCHIYLIGLLPQINIQGMRQDDRRLIYAIASLGIVHEIEEELPDGWHLDQENETWFLRDEQNRRRSPADDLILQLVHRHAGGLRLDVQYIGQAFGKDGSRSALDRLKKHETLQKISVLGIQEGYQLTLLLLEIQPNTQLFTIFNPRAGDKSKGKERIADGLVKLFGTNEHERITLYEASLIRYFRPKFNKEFKNSFPSTDMKVLQDCYDKDFSAIVAEICFDDMPFNLVSDVVAPKPYHVITHHLHEEKSRQLFFSEKA